MIVTTVSPTSSEKLIPDANSIDSNKKRVQDSWIQTTNEEYGIGYMWVTHNDSTPSNRHTRVLWK